MLLLLSLHIAEQAKHPANQSIRLRVKTNVQERFPTHDGLVKSVCWQDQTAEINARSNQKKEQQQQKQQQHILNNDNNIRYNETTGQANRQMDRDKKKIYKPQKKEKKNPKTENSDKIVTVDQTSYRQRGQLQSIAHNGR